MSSSHVTLAYSPCPNDTFIFAAWTQGLLTNVPPIEVILDDVETLNKAGIEGRYPITKASYGAIPALSSSYRILRAGGALGRGCGPLLVCKESAPYTSPAELGMNSLIAIPGTMTTAFLLLQLALGYQPRYTAMPFNEILAAVAEGKVDAGLIIHESRFTYAAAGLKAIVDLGAWWENETGCPIPLGALLVRRDVDRKTGQHVEETIRRSLTFAYEQPVVVMPYVREHAFEMDEDVMRAHIDLYVNSYTHDLGDEGEAAVRELFERGKEARIISAAMQPEFL